MSSQPGEVGRERLGPVKPPHASIPDDEELDRLIAVAEEAEGLSSQVWKDRRLQLLFAAAVTITVIVWALTNMAPTS